MKQRLSESTHRRRNILTGEWILVSPQRTKRPWQGKMSKTTTVSPPFYDPKCYLCPGNTRANGDRNPQYESAFSFVNDFSALLPMDGQEHFQNGLLELQTEPGTCKVICFSPDHSLTLPLMEIPDISKVIKLWQNEYTELGKLDYVNHVQIFENKGEIMGCSNPHPHGQIWAQYTVPEEVRKKQAQQSIYWNRHKKSLLKDYLEFEIEEKERIVIENDLFVALVPFWAIWPYETMIAPKKHYRNIAELNSDEVDSFSDIIKRLTIKYDNLFNISFPYSAGIHQAPTDGSTHEEWHFHMSFYPPLLRSAEIKKFMVGYEMFASPQRDITAETAAELLKKLPEIHYSVQNT